MVRQFLERPENLVGRCAGLAYRLVDARDVAGDFLGAGRRLFHIARNFTGRCALFLHRRGDGRGDLVDLADRLTDALDGADRILGSVLDTADLTADLLGRLGRLIGQVLDFGCDHREALARIAGAPPRWWR